MTQKTNYNLTPHTEELTQIMIDLLLENTTNIAIIAMYGSRARGDYHPTSDLEFFAITDEKIDTAFKPSFLFNGISVDVGLHPKAGYEKMAEREEYWVIPAGTFVTAKLVYWRSEADLAWYNGLKQKMIDDHKDPSIYHLDKAEETYHNMVQALGQLSIAKLHDDLYEAHNNIGSLIICYAIIMAQANGMYLSNNWGMNLDDVSTFPSQPEEALSLLEELVVEKDMDRIIELATKLVDLVRLFLVGMGNPVVKDPPELEMLDSVNSLEYLYKMDKAIALDHMPALSYAITDSEQLFAKDLLKLDGQWKEMSHLLLHSELMKQYHDVFPNLRELMLHGDMERLQQGIELTWNKIHKRLQTEIDLPNFTDIAEIKPYFDRR